MDDFSPHWERNGSSSLVGILSFFEHELYMFYLSRYCVFLLPPLVHKSHMLSDEKHHLDYRTGWGRCPRKDLRMGVDDVPHTRTLCVDTSTRFCRCKRVGFYKLVCVVYRYSVFFRSDPVDSRPVLRSGICLLRCCQPLGRFLK